MATQEHIETTTSTRLQIGRNVSELPSARPVLRLVRLRASVSADTVAALEELLELAKAGQITGMAFGCTVKGGTYVTDVTGECFARPTMARGMVSYLSDQLAGLVHQKSVDEIR